MDDDHRGEPDFSALRASGITAAQAAERLRDAAQHFDPDEFDALIGLHRPELWKRMNKRSSLWAHLLRWRTR